MIFEEEDEWEEGEDEEWEEEEWQINRLNIFNNIFLLRKYSSPTTSKFSF